MRSTEPNEMVQEMGQILQENSCGWELSCCGYTAHPREDFVQWKVEVCNLPGLHSWGSNKRISGTSMGFESTVSKLTGSSKDCHGATRETRGEDPAWSRRPAPPAHLGELLRLDCYPPAPLHFSSSLLFSILSSVFVGEGKWLGRNKRNQKTCVLIYCV